MIIDLISLDGNVVLYIPCFWHLVELVGHETETNEELEDMICIEEGFVFLIEKRFKLTRVSVSEDMVYKDPTEQGFQLAWTKIDRCGERAG